MKARLHRTPVMEVHRKVLDHQKVVYLLVANRAIKYTRGRSRIAYVGTTSKGIQRVASSVAHRAASILSGHGLSSMKIYIVTCRPQRNVRTWTLLEKALIAQFVQWFWQPPRCNSQGMNFHWTPKLDRYFSKKAIDNILGEFDG